MKSLFIVSFVVLFTQGVFGQNLVPNPSFENYSPCPNSTGQLGNTGNWSFVGASTDYYNACSPQGNMGVPSNIYGYQSAAEGDAYIGMIAYAVGDYQQENNFREPAGTSLTQALVIGQKYYLSFKAALTLNDFESGGACNKLGAKFSTISYSYSNPAPVDNFAHIYTNAVVADSSNWVIISGSFVADSAYTFISIGNFFDSTNIQYSDINGLWFTETAYYYIDDIRLSADSNFVLSYMPNYPFKDKQQFSISPNPASNYIFFQFENNQEHLMEIYDFSGKLVLNATIANSGFVNVSSLSRGIYYVRERNRHYATNKKLIIL